jgi:DNA ligase-1
MKETLFSDLASLCEALEGTRKRTGMSRLLGEFMAGLSPEETPMAVNLILGRRDKAPGETRRALNLSGASVLEALDELVGGKAFPPEAPDFGEAVRLLFEEGGRPSPRGERLTLRRVSRTFEEIAGARGPGSRKKKRELLIGLLRASGPLEAKYIVKNVIGEMRHGVDEGMLLEALSREFDIEEGLLRRAYMLVADLGEVAKTAIAEGPRGLRDKGITLFRPLRPMLAQTAGGVEEAFGQMKAPLALEYKLDGARVQIHKKGRTCRLYSRSLTELTGSLPDIAEALMGMKAGEAVLEGEVIAVGTEGSPLPFQVLMRRLGRVREVRRTAEEVPVRLYLFDILYKDGGLLVDLPYRERWEALEGTGLPLVPRIVTDRKEEGEAFFRRAIEEGYEGLVAKDLSSPYAPGVRGKAWLKIKKAVSLDLVIVAAEWGYGRRHGWLSNYHLAARDGETGGYLPVGKTYKGLTDREFKDMTERLLLLKTGDNGGTVFVRPEVVVEVLFSDIQRSPRYESGLALRFARIARIRDDKAPTEADTIETLREIHERQGKPPATP